MLQDFRFALRTFARNPLFMLGAVATLAPGIGVGAASTDVMRLVLGEGVAMAAAGVALGLAGAAALTKLMAGLLFGVTARDPSPLAPVPRC